MTTIEGAPLAQGAVRTDWQGAWVWAEDVQADRNVYAMFRRRFTADASGELEVRITADSFYSLYLDGKFIGHGPARSTLEYYSFDTYVSNLLPGEHCLAVLVHHVGEVNACMMLGRPALLVDATFTSNGQPVNLSTGTDWKSRLCQAWKKDLPCMMSHFGFWEDLDLRDYPQGWTAISFDDSAWSSAVEIGHPPCAPWTRLVAREVELPSYTPITKVSVAGAGQWQEGGTEEAIPSKQVASR